MTTGAVQILQKSLQDAHKSLEYSSNALKRLTGRDPAAPPYRSGPTPERRRSGGGRMRAWSGDYDAPASKRRDSVGGKSRLAGRLGPPVWQEDSERGEPPQPMRQEMRERDGEKREMEMEREQEMGWKRERDVKRREMVQEMGWKRERGGEKREMEREMGWKRERDGKRREIEMEQEMGWKRERDGKRREIEREQEMGWKMEGGAEGEEKKPRKRESEGEDQEVEEDSKPSLQSSVVATTAPPRPKDDPAQDGKSKMRNRRMFGFLMGTLQKFKDKEEASKNSEKEKTRKAIERKLEETAAEEKEAVAQEKRELFQKIKSVKMRVGRIRSHLQMVEEMEGWNQHSRKLLGYIHTRNKPPIFYLPAQHNSETTDSLNRTTAKLEGVIKERQAEIDAMLAEATAPVVGGGMVGEGEGEKEGEGEMDTSQEAPVAGASVGEGGSAQREGEGSESGEVSGSE